VLIVQKFNDALQALTASPDRPIEIRQAKIVRQSRIKDDPTRIQAMVTEYQNRLRQKAQPLAPPPTGGGFNGGGSDMGMPPGIQPGMGMPPGGFAPPGMAGGTASQEIPAEAYQDPVLKEDVRDDTECIVVMAVVVDPNPAATTPGGTPAAKTVAVAISGGPGQP
jgi:hypothetical protein